MAHVAPKTSSRSQLSHRTYVGSQNWLPGHPQQSPYVLPNRSIATAAKPPLLIERMATMDFQIKRSSCLAYPIADFRNKICQPRTLPRQLAGHP